MAAAAATAASPAARSAAVCVGRAAQTARDGGRALSVVRQRVGLRVFSCEVVLAKAVSFRLGACPCPWPWRECGSLPQESPSGECAAEAAGWGPRWIAGSRQVEVARDERGGLAVRLVQGPTSGPEASSSL